MTEIPVWNGPPVLRPFLVALDDLEAFPGNPRRGDVARLRESLRRFGQVLPALADPRLADGERMRLVARHHLALAAREEGWTHIAVVANEFADEEEARAYLLADNHLGELGGYDQEALVDQLAALRDFSGTGYSEEDRQEIADRLAHLRNPVFGESDEVPALDERSAPQTSGLFEVPLLLDRETRLDFARHVRLLEREWGVEGTTAVCVRAVREASART